MKAYALWLEKDLTLEARAGRLPPAFEVDEQVQALADQIEAGRHPLVTGPPGIGKTALVYELVRRVRAAAVGGSLRGRRILQISIQKRLGALKNRYELQGEFDKLVDALRGARRPPALFIRDIHQAYHHDLEHSLSALGCVEGVVIIGEGPEREIRELLEYAPYLQHAFVPVPVDEPSLAQAETILRAWAQEQSHRLGATISPDAVDQALALTHRFVPRAYLPSKAIDLLTQSITLGGRRRIVTCYEVIQRFCRANRVPRALVDPALPLDLEKVRRVFARAVVGQPEAVDAIVDTVGVLKAGLSDVRRPLAALLLVGPTGVGKTYIVQLLAEVLFGRRDRLIRIDMADYPGAGDGQKLFGDPDAKSPGQERVRGHLAAKIAGYPFGVVLLDEFEKANPAVHDRFLQLIDEGVFVNGLGETVPCRSLIFVATSNAACEQPAAKAFGFAPGGSDEGLSLLSRLERYFRFELLNRFDRIVHFQPLGPAEARSIAEAELRRLARRIGVRQRKLVIEVEPAVLDWIVQHGFDVHRGARYLRHTVEQHATAALARVIARDNPSPGTRIRLCLRDGGVNAVVRTQSAIPSDAPVETSPTRTRTVARPVVPVNEAFGGFKPRTPAGV